MACAVAASVVLLVACSSERSSDGSTREERDAYTAAVAANWGLDGNSGFVLIGRRASCVAERWVEAIGVRRLGEVGGEPADLDPRQGGEFDPVAFDLTDDQVRTMVDAFDACEADLVELFVAARAERLDTATRECLRSELSPQLAEALVASSLVAGEPSDDVAAELEELSRTCAAS